jgi:hypothetical protein
MATGIRLPDPSELAKRFADGQPFPHVIVDGFLGAGLVRAVLAEFPETRAMGKQYADEAQVKSASEDPATWGATTRAVMTFLNGTETLRWLEQITGIPALAADPTFRGGGLHQIRRGGKLGIHADFDRHEVTGLARRLNLLIYLNENWQDEWGGHLELWDRSMKSCEVRVAPVAGRAVLFATDAGSFHGHPDPLACPPAVTRKSLALYYYTPDVRPASGRTTQFQVRPASSDRLPSRSLPRRMIGFVRRKAARLR